MKFLLVIIFLVSNLANAQYRLRLNLQKGSTYSQHTTTNLTIDEDVNGQKIYISSTVSGSISFKVLNKTDSGYLLETTYTELSLGMKSSNGEVSYSSNKPYDEKDVFSSLLKNMTKHSFYTNMNSNGTIKEIKGIDSLWSSLFNSFTDLDEAKKKQLLDQLKQSYGENSVKGNIEQLTAIFPNKKVNLNEEWQNEVQLTSTMSAVTKNHFKLISHNALSYELENNAETKTNEDTVHLNEMPAIYKLSGPTVSKLKIDTKTGWILEGTINQQLKGNIDFLDNPKIPGGILIGMTMNSDSKISDK